MRSPIAYLFFFLLLLFLSISSINGFEIYGGNDSDDFDVSKFSLGMSNHGIHSLSNRINNQNNNNNINNNHINQNNNYYNNNHNNNHNGVGFVGDSVTLSTSDKMTPDQEAVIAMLEEQNREWMALAGTGGACDMAGICKNGGTCNNIDGVRHTCLCPPQWTGDSCEIPAISSSSAIIAPTGLTSHLSSSLMTAITGSLTTSLSSGLTNSLSSGLTSSSSSGLTTAGLTTSSSSGITAPPPNTPPPPTTPPPFPLANPSIVEGATGLQAGIIYVSRSRNGNSGFYILGAIATSMSVGFIVYVVAKRDADIDASESFAHLRPKKYRTPIKKKTPAENEEKKFADEEQGGGKRPSPDDVVVDTQPPESKQDVPDAYTVMDFQSVFALKNNVLDQKTTTRPVGETAAAPIDPQLDVHFVLHE